MFIYYCPYCFKKVYTYEKGYSVEAAFDFLMQIVQENKMRKRALERAVRDAVMKRDREANDFLQECFAPVPRTSSYTFCTNDITDAQLGGGKSGAKVFRGFYKGKAAILKLYAPRDKNDIFQMSNKTPAEKADLYRGSTKGDSSLTFIRSIRDIYLSILLQDLSLRGESLTATLYSYGIQSKKKKSKKKKSKKTGRDEIVFVPYIILSDINKGEGYEELLKYDYSDKSKYSNLKLLLRMIEALQIFNMSIVYKNKSIGCHRDFHPGNCFLKEAGGDFFIKFIDFDLSITDRDELTRDKKCDRRTLSKTFIQKQLGQWNRTLGEYTRKILPQTSIFAGTVAEDDADLYMFSIYLSEFLQETEALSNIKVAIANMKKQFPIKKMAFIELLITLLTTEVKRSTFQQRPQQRLKY